MDGLHVVTAESELYAKLSSVASAMQGQDNRITAHPIYVVQKRKRIYGLDPDWCDNLVWLCEGAEAPDDAEETLQAKAFHEEHGYYPDDWTRTGYQDVWEFVQPFFAEKNAEEFIAQNKHNLGDCRIYVESGYRNMEWQTLRSVLLDLLEGLCPGE